jgi:hypothetical protein
MSEYILFKLKPNALKELRSRSNGHITRSEEFKWKEKIMNTIANQADKIIRDSIDDGDY